MTQSIDLPFVAQRSATVRRLSVAALCSFTSLCAAGSCLGGLPNFRDSIRIGTGSDITGAIRFGDIDGDGDQDVVTGNGRAGSDRNAVYLNDGNAGFSESITFGTGRDKTYSTPIGDLNGDGRLDIAVGNNKEQNAVYFGDDEMSFEMTSSFGFPLENTRGLGIAHINDDPYLDLVVANRAGQNFIYLNDGAGEFSEEIEFGTGRDTTINVAIGDLNGDSFADIVTANRNREQNVVYFNDGSGRFPTTVNYGTGSDDTRHVALGDLDLDGDLDIVAGNHDFGGNVIYFNDGSGGFDEDARLGTRSGTNEVAIGDIDRDGDLDIAVGHGGSTNKVFFNDGTGVFPQSVRVGGTNTHSIALGDANGDGFLDLAVGNSHSQNTIYLFSLPFDFDGNGTHGAADLDLLSKAVFEMTNDQTFDVTGDQLVGFSDLLEFVTTANGLNTYIGDANLDGQFNSGDIVNVLQAGKYATDQTARWNEGDWNGDERFDRADIIVALQYGGYGQGSLAASTEQAAGGVPREGPFPAIASGGRTGDGQTSIVYNSSNGELSLDAPTGVEMTSINVDSAAGIFTGVAAQNLGGSFDNDADANIFKATFGGSFGSVSFGNVAQAGMSEEFVLGDLSVVGSLAGGGDLGNVDLVYVPEPMSILSLTVGTLIGLLRFRRASR